MFEILVTRGQIIGASADWVPVRQQLVPLCFLPTFSGAIVSC